MSDEVIVCIGRRRLDVSVVDGKVQLRIMLGDKPLAHLLIEWDQAQILVEDLESAVTEIMRPRTP